jgi:hypothetical protein
MQEVDKGYQTKPGDLNGGHLRPCSCCLYSLCARGAYTYVMYCDILFRRGEEFIRGNLLEKVRPYNLRTLGYSF